MPCIVCPKAMRWRTSYGKMGVFYRNPGAELLPKDCPLLHELAQKILVVDKKMGSHFANKS